MATATEARSARTPPAAPQPVRAAPRSWLHRHARLAGLLTFVALSFVWFARTWVDPVHRHAGLAGDPESYMFALAWPRFALQHGLSPFYTSYLVAPHGANLMWTVPPGFG